MSPDNAFRIDSKAIKYIDQDIITTAFLHFEERKVDKAGCISFEGEKYEVGVSFVGCRVDVIYDPADTTEITIEYEGHPAFKARQLVIGERTGKRPSLPEHIQPLKAEESRLLKEASKKNQQRKSIVAPAISYRGLGKAGDGNV